MSYMYLLAFIIVLIVLYTNHTCALLNCKYSVMQTHFCHNPNIWIHSKYTYLDFIETVNMKTVSFMCIETEYRTMHQYMQPQAKLTKYLVYHEIKPSITLFFGLCQLNFYIFRQNIG